MRPASRGGSIPASCIASPPADHSVRQRGSRPTRVAVNAAEVSRLEQAALPRSVDIHIPAAIKPKRRLTKHPRTSPTHSSCRLTCILLSL